MNERKSCISLNINSKFYIYPMLLPVACMLTHFFQKIMCKNSIPENGFLMLKYNLPLLFYYFLPKIFSFIFIFIIKHNTKEEKENEQNKLLRRYHFTIKTENSKKILFLIYVISLLEVLFKVGDSILSYLQKIEIIHYLIEKRTGFIISVPFFSYILLNKKLYKHHIFSLILAFCGAFIVNFCRFPLGFSEINEYLYHILNILFSFIFALSLVLIKFLLTKYFIVSPYVFLFYDGIFCIINLFIIILLEYPIITNIHDENKNVYIDKEKENENYFINNYLKIFTILKGQNDNFYFSFFFAIISSFCYFILNILTLYNFSPYLNVLTDFLTPFLYNILNFIFLDPNKTKKDYLRYLFESLGYIIVIIGALILNEIIILNFCGFNENTYKNIIYRGSLDFNIGPYNGTDDTLNTENETEGDISSN